MTRWPVNGGANILLELVEGAPSVSPCPTGLPLARKTAHSATWTRLMRSPGDSASLKACNDLLMEYLPKLKALPGAEITRQVCGGCLDFKVSISQPLEEHGAFMADLALEEEFMGKLKAIEGTSLHETQEITFVTM